MDIIAADPTSSIAVKYRNYIAPTHATVLAATSSGHRSSGSLRRCGAGQHSSSSLCLTSRFQPCAPAHAHAPSNLCVVCVDTRPAFEHADIQSSSLLTFIVVGCTCSSLTSCGIFTSTRSSRKRGAHTRCRSRGCWSNGRPATSTRSGRPSPSRGAVCWRQLCGHGPEGKQSNGSWWG